MTYGITKLFQGIVRFIEGTYDDFKKDMVNGGFIQSGTNVDYRKASTPYNGKGTTVEHNNTPTQQLKKKNPLEKAFGNASALKINADHNSVKNAMNNYAITKFGKPLKELSKDEFNSVYDASLGYVNTLFKKSMPLTIKTQFEGMKNYYFQKD